MSRRSVRRFVLLAVLVMSDLVHADEKTFPGSACEPEDWLFVPSSVGSPLLSVVQHSGSAVLSSTTSGEPWFTCPVVRDEMQWVSPKYAAVWVSDAHPSKSVTCELRWRYFKSTGQTVLGVAPMGSTGAAATGLFKLSVGHPSALAPFPQDTSWWIRCQLHEAVVAPDSAIYSYWVEEY